MIAPGSGSMYVATAETVTVTGSRITGDAVSSKGFFGRMWDSLKSGVDRVFSKKLGTSNNQALHEGVDDMANSGIGSATVVGAELPNGAASINTSGPIPDKIAPSLESAANKIGGVGTVRDGNTIGCCGEFRAGNDVLLQNPQYKPTDVKFTPAIRPRTGQVIPPCKNCKDIFGQ